MFQLLGMGLDGDSLPQEVSFQSQGDSRSYRQHRVRKHQHLGYNGT